MTGFGADVDAMRAAGAVLREAADSVSSALGQLDGGGCAEIGPGRLGPAVGRLTEEVRRDLDRMSGTLGMQADLVHATARGYAAYDQAAADELTRRAGGSD